MENNIVNKYITKSVNENIPINLQVILWDLYDNMEVSKKDYLQIFNISTEDNYYIIKHQQEVPEYEKITKILIDEQDEIILVNDKLYIIDDITHLTLLMAYDY